MVVVGALLSTLFLTILVRKRPKEFASALVALLSLVGTQVVFWLFTFPVNQQTSNWSTPSENWMALRIQWEYSHATSAVLNFIAVVALIYSVLARPGVDSLAGDGVVETCGE